ncbi:MAG TPA: hypothetical protein VIK01_03295 [Polyangiaceae bacterium]
MTALETLRALGTGSDAPSESKQRVYGALVASLEAAALAGATAGATALPKPPPSLPPAPLLAGIAGSKTLAIAASIWLLGGVTGAALYGALRPSQVRVVYVDRQAPVASAAPLAKEPEPTVSAGVAPPSAASNRALVGRAALRAASSSLNLPGSQLAQERALLDLARSNAAHGEAALALEQVEQHRKQFPQGRLAEEREALGIRALLSLGRKQEAQDRAQAFRVAYPNSFLLPVIDSALSTP